MTTEPTPYTFPDNHRGTLSGLIEAARTVLASYREPAAQQQLHRQALATNARELATSVATRVRQKPIPPALIAAGVGVGLIFLFSKRARGAALTAGSFALDQYRRRLP